MLCARQVEFSASGWSLVQRSPTKCDVTKCDLEPSTMRRPWPAGAIVKKERSLKVRYTFCNAADKSILGAVSATHVDI